MKGILVFVSNWKIWLMFMGISDVNSFHLSKYNLMQPPWNLSTLIFRCVPLFGQHLLPGGLFQKGSIFPFVVLAVLPVVYWCVGMLVYWLVTKLLVLFVLSCLLCLLSAVRFGRLSLFLRLVWIPLLGLWRGLIVWRLLLTLRVFFYFRLVL